MCRIPIADVARKLVSPSCAPSIDPKPSSPKSHNRQQKGCLHQANCTLLPVQSLNISFHLPSHRLRLFTPPRHPVHAPPTLPTPPIQLARILHHGKRTHLTRRPVGAVGVEGAGGTEVDVHREVDVAVRGEGDGVVAHFAGLVAVVQGGWVSGCGGKLLMVDGLRI